jgi:carbon starvation protein
MLIESFLAIISVGAVLVISRTEYASRLTVEGPVTMFADGLGGIISSTGISVGLATSFVALAVSAFALTTLDTCTRLTRFTLQEYFEDVDNKAGKMLARNRYIATFIVVTWAVFLLTSGEFTTLWPIFGSANQMLAAMALLAVAVWLIKKKVNPTFVLIPMFFMFAVTLSSLFLFAVKNYNDGIYILAVLAGVLFLLSFVLIYLAKESLKKELKNPDKVLKKV